MQQYHLHRIIIIVTIMKIEVKIILLGWAGQKSKVIISEGNGVNQRFDTFD